MMRFSKSAKILLGIASLWPLVYMLLFFALIGTFFFMAMFHGGDTVPQGQGFPIAFGIVFLLHFFTIVFALALCAFYIVYLFKTDRVRQDKKALWAVVLFFGGMFAFPVFWYLYVWPDDRNADAVSASV